MPAPAIVQQLVDRFQHNRASYQAAGYNETQLRREFLDPLFKALGWDVDNEQGHAEAYKDVIHEDAIKVGGATKAPDYCFRIGGRRIFFLEAKKPAVNVKTDDNPAFQLRRYAWSAKLPLSILSDFEELAVYDCRQKPNKGDKAAIGRILFLTFDEYVERWDELAGIFSREAVLKGSFDKFAESKKGKRGTAEVDAAFLEEIESWRDVLARNFALRNPELSQRDLNFAVQRTIDRIIFLRMCEDRGVEQYGQLGGLSNGEAIYPRLCQVFERADERYNSGLFHFHKEKGRAEPPDELTTSLELDDKPLREILRGLYYPDCPYEFSVLPAEILGHVYEQFLGKVIRLTASHKAVVEDKPEVKKAGGVYYTPSYIVDYIVQQTVGKLVEKQSPKQVSKLRVLDPACGSGSFLVGAYQFLLDWHRDWYLDDGVKKHSKEIYQGAGGQWLLTTAEKKRILLNNIYGVDIDSQAVEVTKLSLLLKVLENENQETLERQLRLLHERALPDLGNNIKCGNSLIGPDFYNGQQMSLLDDEEQYRINAFDWQAEFPEILKGKHGGFDAVIGNPPYVRIQTMNETAPEEVAHYKVAYKAASRGNYDIYVVFIERGLGLLNSTGKLGFILPHKFFNAKYGQPIRTVLASGQHLSHVVHFGDQQVFYGATTYCCILIAQRLPTPNFSFSAIRDLEKWKTEGIANSGLLKAPPADGSEWTFSTSPLHPLRERLLARNPTLGTVASIFVGLQTSADKIYILEEANSSEGKLVHVRDRQGQTWKLERGCLKSFLNDVTVETYHVPLARHWLVFPYDIAGTKAALIDARTMKSQYPRTWEYLQENAKELRNRDSGKADHEGWYGYVYRKNLTLFAQPKIIVQVISRVGRYAIDERGYYFTGGGNGPYYGVRWLESSGRHSLLYLQALLSSRLLDSVLRTVSSPFRGGYWSYGKRFIEQLPVHQVNWERSSERKLYEAISGMARRATTVNEQLMKARSPDEKTRLKRQVDGTIRQIDQLVYELYGLTDEEIALVEAADA